MKESKEKIKYTATGFFSEFRNFAIKGNVLDVAIAVVLGNAFGAIVNSLVADIITPLLGVVTGNGTVDVKNLAITLKPAVAGAAAETPAILLSYGSFIQTVLNFLIISLSIFLVFKVLSHARRRLFTDGEEAMPADQIPPQELLLEEIRDLLKENLQRPQK